MNAVQERTVTDRVRRIVARTMDVSVDVVTPESCLNYDFAADSMDKAEMAMAIEEEFDIELGDEAMALTRIRQIVDYVEAKSHRRG